MSVEGVWKIEMLSPYGWDAVATAFLQNGQYLGASANHYSIGRYEEDGQTLKAEVRITQHGQVRTVFGSKKEQVDTTIKAEIQTADRIEGTASASGAEKFDVSLRMTRLGGLN